MKKNIYSIGLALLLTLQFSNAQQSQYENLGKEWISQNALSLKSPNFTDYKLSFVYKGKSGETLRYQQTLNGIPVYNSEIVVHVNKQGKISQTTENVAQNLKNINTDAAFNLDTALQKVITYNKKSVSETEVLDKELVVFVNENQETKLAYRIVTHSDGIVGTWESMVDAKNGEILSSKDISHKHHHEPKVKKEIVSGEGYVFDPDPLAPNRAVYGGNYRDNDDATNEDLDAARKLVTLDEIDFSEGLYHLRNSRVRIAELETPAKGVFSQETNSFLFDRSEDGFEAVNSFYHLDKNLRYINEELGLEVKPLTNNGVLLVDPHARDGDDNSAYSYDRLYFGEGYVDDAEDADVVLHELGHGLHDWVTNRQLSQVQGLSEGSGDYWAQSYKRSLGYWQASDAQYNWVFGWDGHNEFWPGRVTNYNSNYPPSGFSIHSQGQLWSTVLMSIYDIIGRRKTDIIFLEGLARTNKNSNQKVAAQAALQVAIDLKEAGEEDFTCDDILTITEKFNEKNFGLTAYDGCDDLSNSNLVKNSISIYPNPVKDVIKITNLAVDDIATLVNTSGQKVLEVGVNKSKNEININQLPKGVYILSLKNSKKTIKVIKN